MPFPLEDTQAYRDASDPMIFVVIRGTEPAQIRDWLADANTPVMPGPARKARFIGVSVEHWNPYIPRFAIKIEGIRTNDQTLRSTLAGMTSQQGLTRHLSNNDPTAGTVSK